MLKHLIAVVAVLIFAGWAVSLASVEIHKVNVAFTHVMGE